MWGGGGGSGWGRGVGWGAMWEGGVVVRLGRPHHSTTRKTISVCVGGRRTMRPSCCAMSWGYANIHTLSTPFTHVDCMFC